MKYRVLLAYNAYQEYEVEADDEFEAVDKAEKLAPVDFCELERHPSGDFIVEI